VPNLDLLARSHVEQRLDGFPQERVAAGRRQGDLEVRCGSRQEHRACHAAGCQQDTRLSMS
jgi:hypothetical protein